MNTQKLLTSLAAAALVAAGSSGAVAQTNRTTSLPGRTIQSTLVPNVGTSPTGRASLTTGRASIGIAPSSFANPNNTVAPSATTLPGGGSQISLVAVVRRRHAGAGRRYDKYVGAERVGRNQPVLNAIGRHRLQWRRHAIQLGHRFNQRDDFGLRLRRIVDSGRQRDQRLAERAQHYVSERAEHDHDGPERAWPDVSERAWDNHEGTQRAWPDCTGRARHNGPIR